MQMNTLEDVYRVTKGESNGTCHERFQERQWIESPPPGGIWTPSRRWSTCMRKRVMALALRMCRSPEDAAEAAQEAFLAAWQGLPILRGRGQFFHLAVPAGLQRRVDLLRREGRHRAPPVPLPNDEDLNLHVPDRRPAVPRSRQTPGAAEEIERRCRP